MRLPSDFTDIIVKALPVEVRSFLIDRGEHLIVAGGFCRDILSGKDPKDIDIFAVSKAVMDDAIGSFGWLHTMSRKQTANSVTFEQFLPTEEDVPIQFVTRVYYPDHEELIHSFDFSVCQIGVYYETQADDPHAIGWWVGICSDQFWRDLPNFRATYMDPARDEDPGGSLLRMVKFAEKGYKVKEADIAAVVGRFYSNLSGEPKETATAKVRTCFRRVGYAGKQALDPLEDWEKE